MAEIKSSGSAAVIVTSASGPGVFGAWVALNMGVDQATHPITFDSTWGHIVMADDVPVSGNFVGRRHDVEIGRGPTSPPAEIIWGPMRFTTISAGGGRGLHTNYSFPLVLSAGDQLWARQKSSDTQVRTLVIFVTVSDQVQPIRPATVHFSTRKIFAPVTPNGVLFPASDVLGLWYLMGNDGSGGGMPLTFNSSWMSMNIELFAQPSTQARWQLGASTDGNPPDLPELIDVGFQSLGGAPGNISEVGDVHNFPIPWVKGEALYVRGAVKGGTGRTFAMAATIWGNP